MWKNVLIELMWKCIWKIKSSYYKIFYKFNFHKYSKKISISHLNRDNEIFLNNSHEIWEFEMYIMCISLYITLSLPNPYNCNYVHQ